MINDLNYVEKRLYREVNDSEAAYILRYGKDEFLNNGLGLDAASLDAYNKAIKLLVAYYTQSDEEFHMLLKEDGVDEAYLILENLLCEIENKDESAFDFGLDGEAKESTEVTDGTLYTVSRCMQIEKVISSILEAGVDKEWLDLYDEVDPNHASLIDYASDAVDEGCTNMDEVIANGLDNLKDEVVKQLALKLKTTGEKMELPADVIDEVSDYLFKTEPIVSIYIRNNEISVRV